MMKMSLENTKHFGKSSFIYLFTLLSGSPEFVVFVERKGFDDERSSSLVVDLWPFTTGTGNSTNFV